MGNGYHFVACILLLLGLLVWAPGSSRAETLTVDAAECRLLQRYQPEPGQDPAYQPGRDVRGRPVAPADVEGSARLDLPESYEFDVEVRPRDRGLLNDSRIKIGRVSVAQGGELLWNGRPLQGARQAALLDLCRSQAD